MYIPEQQEEMTVENKLIIKQKRRELVKNIIPIDVVAKLKQKQIIDDTEAHKVRSHKEMSHQVDSLLKILVTKKNSAFASFIQILYETDQHHVARLLQEGEFILFLTIIYRIVFNLVNLQRWYD